MTESIKMTGYKATKADMTCQPDKNKPAFQFEMGVWYEVEGEIEECKNGFHFCEHPSGVWSYYSDADARVFKIEAEEVLPKKSSPGADRKRVCRRIRLTEEMTFRNPSNRNSGDYNTGYHNSGYRNSGNRNSGDCNSGNRNSGDCNSGNRNSGDCNSGYRNSGDCNSGYRNSGYRNSGDYNSGDYNSGDRNSGDYNSGDYNTGYRNSGDYNSGDRNSGNYNSGDRNSGNYNSGDYNATNFSAGFFCVEEPLVVCFDVQTNLTRSSFFNTYPEYQKLGKELSQDAEIDFAPYANLPGITPEKLKILHERHIEGRRIAHV